MEIVTSSIPTIRARFDYGPQELRTMYGLENVHLQRIRELSDQAQPHIETTLDDFYAWMGAYPEMMSFFRTQSVLEHVRHMQTLYWKRFFAAEVDDNYLADRKRIGSVHAKIGLPLMIYMAAVNFIYPGLHSIAREITSAVADVDITTALSSLLHMDAGLICQAFQDGRDEHQSNAAALMSAPVTEIWNGILLLPVIGIVDSKRSEDIMNAVLYAIKNTKAKEFILDISGVAVVDTAVANYLIRITKATSLMGCRTTISGISPSISMTIVQLGIDVGSVSTTSTMMDALQDAFSNCGYKMSKLELG
ncbi:MAG: protoglobin domain-containing protein [Synechococcaceae cyanobacterium ELA445]